MQTQNALRDLRDSVGVTQSTMAEHMGVPLRTYEDLEAGHSKIRPVHLNAARWAIVTICGDAAISRGPMPLEIIQAIGSATGK